MIVGQRQFPHLTKQRQLVMSTSSTRKYKYSWEIPKRKLVLDSYSSMRVPVWDMSTLRDEYYEYSSEYLPLRVLALSEYSSLCEYSLSICTMYLAYIIRSSLHMHGVGYCKQRWLALLW